MPLHNSNYPLDKRDIQLQNETKSPKAFVLNGEKMPTITLETKKPAKTGSFPTISKGVEK